MLKHPKKPTEKNNNKILLVIFNAIKIPKNKEARIFTIKMLLKKNSFLLPGIYCINTLKISPIVLPTKR